MPIAGGGCSPQRGRSFYRLPSKNHSRSQYRFPFCYNERNRNRTDWCTPSPFEIENQTPRKDNCMPTQESKELSPKRMCKNAPFWSFATVLSSPPSNLRWWGRTNSNNVLIFEPLRPNPLQKLPLARGFRPAPKSIPNNSCPLDIGLI